MGQNEILLRVPFIYTPTSLFTECFEFEFCTSNTEKWSYAQIEEFELEINLLTIDFMTCFVPSRGVTF